jgi:serine phosphatase RsbU (regulator of sigma subunit)
MATRRPAGLIDPEALAALVSAAGAVIPSASIVVRDAAGADLARHGPAGRDAVASRPIDIEGEELGEVAVEGTLDPVTAGALAGLVATAISTVAAEALQQEGFARQRLADELAIGRRIQRSLMPRRFPALPGWEIAAAYEAAREVGGDLYDAFLLVNRPGHLAFTMADVTGKGIPAAILMADTRALIHAAADHTTDPADVLIRVNRVLLEERATSLFVTVAFGVVEAETGALALASAGHDPLHAIRADGTLETLESGGRMIGMVADIQARTVPTTIGPGDALVAHTDGVTEARSPNGGFYGEDRFEGLLATLAGRSATEVVDAVVADVTEFRAGAEPSDDLTLLVLRRLPTAGSATARPA